MKTLNDGIIEFLKSGQGRDINGGYLPNEWFKAGVEFAQRWTPVEEELPEVGEMVLTKMEKRHGDTWVQNYYSTATRLENQGEWQTVNWVDHSISFGHITHWRYIDIK